ncbi:ASCH domain-containing protein [Marinilactibacillus piezotolerans]|uniref:ASCH domain-containing protein n=1 Tax=Marinilactibacillus piezotolerans TaxID=258723 RepID=UPI0009B0985D|nr:ASCH domain-containing protein [Marinilactibacillus piezotolerans]
MGNTDKIHQMGLYEEYLESIKQQTKWIEVRLNDEKRQKIKIGDFIEFTKVPQLDESIIVKVTDLKKYKSFKDMYLDSPFAAFGCEGWTLEELVKGTYEIYSIDQEREFGALAIGVKYID